MKLGVRAALVDGLLVPGDVEIADGRIAGYGLAASNGVGIAAPGFVDLQVNGFAGVDFGDAAMTPERVLHAVAAIGKTGVTRFLATLITSSFETFSACARTLLRTADPAIAGIHMEGPYISPEDGPRGAHDRDHVRAAEVEDFRRRQDAAEGRIRLITIAPESPGAVRCGSVLSAARSGHRITRTGERSLAIDALDRE